MKKLLLALLMIGNIEAATTGTLVLQATVAQDLPLTVTAEAVASSLDLSTSQTGLKVGTVNEKSNSGTGYTISAKSTNGSLLKNGALDQLSYQITYDGGSAITLTTSDQTVKTQSTGGLYDHDSDVDIVYTGKAPATMVQGTYSDTITFTIAAI